MTPPTADKAERECDCPAKMRWCHCPPRTTPTPPTADATEALARVLRESAEPFGKVDWMEFARRAAAKGVTLPPPAVAPSPTPLQAASAAVHAELMDRFGGAKLLYTRLDTDGIARAVLAAAVGALPGGPQPDECSIGSGMERQLVLRAALLAALTEGGEG